MFSESEDTCEVTYQPFIRKDSHQAADQHTDTLRVIDDTAFEIALVVDEQLQLIGTVTDGDIRRGIIRGADLNSPIESLMNRRPITATQNTPDDELLFLMTNRSIKHRR